MGSEEKVGAAILVLLLFSIGASLVPVRIRHKAGPASLSLPLLTGAGELSGSIYSSSIHLMVDVGQVEVIEDPSTEMPSVSMQGASPVIENGVARIVAGRVTLNLPEEWNGDLSVKLGMGNVVLRDASVGDLRLDVGIGSVEGSVNVVKNATIKMDKGNVRLTVGVPKDAKVHVKVRSLEGSVYYEGQKLQGGVIDRTFGQGEKVVNLEVSSYSVQLYVRTVKG